MSDRVEAFVEQLGVPASERGFRHSEDVLPRGIPGVVAKLNVARERGDWDLPQRGVIERLGVQSSENGFRRRRDILGRGLWGAMGIVKVARQDGGFDPRRALEAVVDHHVLPINMPTGRKALITAALYRLARRLPTRR